MCFLFMYNQINQQYLKDWRKPVKTALIIMIMIITINIIIFKQELSTLTKLNILFVAVNGGIMGNNKIYGINRLTETNFTQ